MGVSGECVCTYMCTLLYVGHCKTAFSGFFNDMHAISAAAITSYELVSIKTFYFDVLEQAAQCMFNTKVVHG